MPTSPNARIEHLIKYMEYDYLTDRDHEIVIDLEEDFREKGTFTSRQLALLESINKNADLRDRPLRR